MTIDEPSPTSENLTPVRPASVERSTLRRCSRNSRSCWVAVPARIRLPSQSSMPRDIAPNDRELSAPPAKSYPILGNGGPGIVAQRDRQATLAEFAKIGLLQRSV